MGIFDGLIGSVVSGVGGVVQNYMSGERQDATNEFNANQAAITREYNSEEAQKNRDYQTQMSNSAFQRGMADMKAAGLNPILAYQKGGANSPGGSVASASHASGGTAPVSNVGEAMVHGYNNSARAASENAKTDAGKSLLEQELVNARLTADQIRSNTAKTLAETGYVQTQTKLSGEHIGRTKQETEKLQSENTARSVDSSYYNSTFGRGVRWIGNTLGEINPLKGLLGGFGR